MASNAANNDPIVIVPGGTSFRRSSPHWHYGPLAGLLVDHQDLDDAKRRELLASWASDVNAVEGRPSLRRIPGSDAVVPIDTILDALKRLDGEDDHPCPSPSPRTQLPVGPASVAMPP